MSIGNHDERFNQSAESTAALAARTVEAGYFATRSTISLHAKAVSLSFGYSNDSSTGHLGSGFEAAFLNQACWHTASAEARSAVLGCRSPVSSRMTS